MPFRFGDAGDDAYEELRREQETAQSPAPPTTATQRALRYLNQVVSATAGEIGAELWPDGPPGGGKGASASGGGYYATQMLLGRLRKAGLVADAGGSGTTLWKITSKGRTEVKS